jgi:hypothetical protein
MIALFKYRLKKFPKGKIPGQDVLLTPPDGYGFRKKPDHENHPGYEAKTSINLLSLEAPWVRQVPEIRMYRMKRRMLLSYSFI